MIDDFMKAFWTEELSRKLDASGIFDSATIKTIYEMAEDLGLSITDASLLAIVCLLKKQSV
jgi:hypothetical protein